MESKRNWLFGMFCCRPEEKEKVEVKEVEPRKRQSTTVKKKGRIQLSLIGSTFCFNLCKLSRKNVAIDGYRFKGTLPNQVNRYLSERIRAETAIIRGEISSIVLRNIFYPIRISYHKETCNLPSQSEMVVARLGSFRKEAVDTYICRPTFQEAKCFTTTQCLSQFPQQLHDACMQFDRVILMLPPEIVLDQLGSLIPCLPNKETEIESVMVNGTCIAQIVYIADNHYIRIRQEQKIEFIIRELSLQAEKDTQAITTLINQLLKSLHIEDVLKMLVEAIAASKTQPLLMCFLRVVASSSIIKTEELEKMFKFDQCVIVPSYTPNLAKTCSFGRMTVNSIRVNDEFINKGQIVSHKFQVQSLVEEQFTLDYCLKQ